MEARHDSGVDQNHRAVHVLESFPKNYVVAHLSDTHLGKEREGKRDSEDINNDGALDIITGFLFEIAWHQGRVAEACEGFDATGDDEIDGEELAQLGGGFGAQCANPLDPVEWWIGVDYNGDCLIDGEDLAILTSSGVWGRCLDIDGDGLCGVCDPETEECSELVCSFTCP